MSGKQSISPAALRSEAAQWYNQRLAGDMTVDDEYRFQGWLNRSDAHRNAYRSIDRAWFIAGAATGDPTLSDEAPLHRPVARRWRRFALAASILLVVGVAWAMVPSLLFDMRDRPVQAFQTQTGQRTKITLPDGSVVTLDSETAMRFADKPDVRQVTLVHGRAFFQVAKNRSRPFIVSAGGKQVRAVGTAFEVGIEQGEMTVVLAEGKVRVEDASSAGTGNGTDMTPGRQLVVSADRKWTLSNVDVKKETSWTRGRLVFMHDPLSKAIAEVNRYSARKLIFEDGTIPDKQIVGVFSAGDTDGFVKALELYGIAKPVSASSDRIVLADGK